MKQDIKILSFSDTRSKLASHSADLSDSFYSSGSLWISRSIVKTLLRVKPAENSLKPMSYRITSSRYVDSIGEVVQQRVVEFGFASERPATVAVKQLNRADASPIRRLCPDLNGFAGGCQPNDLAVSELNLVQACWIDQ